MRRSHTLLLLVVLLLPAVTIPLAAAESDSIAICEGRSCYVNGSMDSVDRLRGRYPAFAWLERNGSEWLVTDAAMLARMKAVIQPQIELGKRQAKLGEEQAKLGAEQARLGGKQAQLGARQAAIALDRDADDVREDLERRQRELGRQQEELGRQQGVLGRRQGELGKQQEKASAAAKSKLAALFEEAMTNGTAKRMHF